MGYQFHKISVLVVEDNQPMLDIAKALLTTFGIGHVITARNGENGYKKFCKFNPDIILADWMMKPMDGISLARKIRVNPISPNPYVPIILMTGFSEKRRILQARDAGITETLVKPFSARDLYRRIAQIIERPRQFVHSGDFFGPDRRRKKLFDYNGPHRREDDFQSPEGLLMMEQRQKEAHAHLKRVREHAGLGKGDKFTLNPNDIDMV